MLGEIGDPSEREAICENVHLIDQGEADLHLRGRATRLKIKRLRRYWFETGILMVIELDQPAHREW